MNNTERNSLKGLYPAMLLSILVMYFFLANVESGSYQFIIMYAMIGAALLLVLLLNKAFSLLPERDVSEGLAKRITFFTGLLVFAASVAAFCARSGGEDGTLPKALNLYTHPVGITVFLVMFYFAVRALQRPVERLAERKVWLKTALNVACVVVLLFVFASYAVTVYGPYLTAYGDYMWHHQIAVTQSIYNIARNVPYTSITSSIYGHYAIFFLPVVKLFGAKPVPISVMMSVISLLVVLAMAYTGYKNGGLFMAAVCMLASCYSGLQGYPPFGFWQYYPLRYLWPVLVLAYITVKHEKGTLFRPGSIILGYFLCGLAAVWNTDTGFCVTVAFSGVLLMMSLKENRLFSRNTLKMTGVIVLGCLGALAEFLAVINLYNLCVGGPLIFRECFYPMLEHFVSDLQTSVQEWGGKAGIWFIPILLFFLCICFGFEPLLSECAEPIRKHRERLMIIGIMGFSQCYYYFNRTIAGPGCIMLYAMLALGLFAGMLLDERLLDQPVHFFRRGLQKGLAEFCAFELIALCIGGLGCGIWEARYIMKNQPQEKATHESFVEWVREHVPKDTYALGYCVQEIYAELGWDTGYHLRDVSDFYIDTKAADIVKETMERQNALFIGPGVDENLYKDAGFVCADSYTVNDITNVETTWYYYVRPQTALNGETQSERGD